MNQHYAWRMHCPEPPRWMLDAVQDGSWFQDRHDLSPTRLTDYSQLPSGDQLIPTVPGLNYRASDSRDLAWHQWLHDNIGNKWHDPRVMLQNQGCRQGTYSAHTDTRRQYALNFYIDTGGDQAQLNYYRYRDLPIHCGPGIHADDYAHLSLIASYQPRAGEWWLLETFVMHDVTNLTRQRLLLQLNYFDPGQKELGCFPGYPDHI